MNFLLKIVRGPNAGAEIALVGGLCISVGKADTCDIVLADPTLPDEPLQIEAQDDGVTLTAPGAGREHIKPFHVRTFGSTSFAIGPADSAWEPLVEDSPKADADEGAKDGAPAADDASAPAEPPADGEPADSGRKPRKSAVGCLLAFVVLLLVLVAAGWFLREMLEEKWREWRGGGASQESSEVSQSASEASTGKETFEDVLARHGVVATNSNGRAVFMRNFKTRAERLAAAGEVYASRPGVDLDFSDDESFRTAATDLVFTLTEGELGVVAATNRVLVLSGTSPSPAALKRTLKALSADLPYLANVVCDDVSWAADSESASTVPVSVVAASTAKMNPSDYPAVVQVKVPAQVPSFPVCGVMTTPVPCLMLRNGARVLEGASFEGYTIERIEADAVTVSNATGRITWKP